MIIEEELRTALVGMSAVTDIVGARVWDEWFRSTTLPAVVFEFDNEDQENDLSGRGGLIHANVNIICRAETRRASRALSEAVRANGTSPGSGLAGYSGVFDAWLEDRQNAAVPKDDGGNTFWYDVNMSFVLSWSEAR
jgi:Protein of unknown function (DUF3168)